MITGRATAVTKSSIKALYKVCHRGNYVFSKKVEPLCKSLSTATEAYRPQVIGNDSDPESGNQDWVAGGVRSFDSIHVNQGLGNEFNRNLEGFGGNRDTRGSGDFESQSFDRNVRGNNRRISGGTGVGEYRQEWDGYKWSNAKEPARNSREQAVNLSPRSGRMWNGSAGQLSGNGVGLNSESGGMYNQDGANTTNYQAGGHPVPSGNSGSVSGFRQYQPTNNTNYAVSNFGQYQQANNSNYASSNFEQHQQAVNNNYATNNFWQHQQAVNNNYASSNFGQHQRADNGNYASRNFTERQPAYNSDYAQSNSRQYQQADNNNYAPSVGVYQPTAAHQNVNVSPTANRSQYQWSTNQQADNNKYAPSVGEYQPTAAYQNVNVSPTANRNQYQWSNVAAYQQNPYPNLIYNKNTGSVPLQSNSTAQYPSTGSQVPGTSNMDGNSTDAIETPQIRGTIEELKHYTNDGKLKEALEVLELLEKNQQRLVPERDMSTVVKLMEACGEDKADKEAKVVHQALVKLMSPLTVIVYNKILDMYLKCGSIEEAYSLFNEIPNADVSSWVTMIRGLIQNDLGEEAIDIFTEFKNTELELDGQMFLGVFSACGIVGDVSEGMLHFHSMTKQYGITPSMEHYVGVVAMLGHAGYLDNALEFVEKMPVKPSVDVWETLMHFSRIQGNVELGDRCAELVEKLDPSRLSEQSKAGLIPLKASDLEKDKEKKKLASKNLLEVRSRVHEYRAGDTSHPENDRIYALLRGLKTQMKEAGYVPELRGVLHDIDPEWKEEALLAHSERLAAAYGFLTTAARQPIRVIKNLRVCVDCHNALKIISKLVGRELIMRDAKRFHHFKDGACSCKDYW